MKISNGCPAFKNKISNFRRYISINVIFKHLVDSILPSRDPMYFTSKNILFQNSYPMIIKMNSEELYKVKMNTCSLLHNPLILLLFPEETCYQCDVFHFRFFYSY